MENGQATRKRPGRSGHGKFSHGKLQPQRCQPTCDVLLSLVSPVGGGTRFRVLEDLELDDSGSRAPGHQQKRALRQVSPATDKPCSRKQDDCTSGAAIRQQ